MDLLSKPRKKHEFITELKNQGIGIIGDESDNVNYFDKTITLPLVGSMATVEDKQKWEKRLEELGLKRLKLIIRQGDDSKILKEVQNLQDLYAQNQKIISSRDETIKEKEDRIRLLENELNRFYKNTIPFKEVSEEARINYEDLKAMSYYDEITTNFDRIDSISVFAVQWNEKAKKKTIEEQEQKLKHWLKKRLDLDTLEIIRK